MIAAFDRRRFLIMLTGVFGMGVFLSFLVGADYGTDTSTFMNTSIAARTGLSFGTTMLLTNGLLFLIPLFRGRHLIGAGTICNMTVVGYTCDLFRYLEQRFMPADAFTSQPSRPQLGAMLDPEDDAPFVSSQHASRNKAEQRKGLRVSAYRHGDRSPIVRKPDLPIVGTANMEQADFRNRIEPAQAERPHVGFR